MPVISTAKMTSRQFLLMGEDPPGVRLELVNGEIAVSPSPRPRHARVEKRLSYFLMHHLLSHDLGELLGDVDTIFGEYDIRRPDLVYFAKSRTHLIGEGAIKGPPDLCVEIVSPTSGTIDRRDKFELYAGAGVENYWIVDPAGKSVEAFQLQSAKYALAVEAAGDATMRLPPFLDLEIDLSRVW